jgi:dienelactone hydrolase
MNISRPLAAAALVATICFPAFGQTFRTEVHPVPTRSPSTEDFLIGKEGAPALVAGELRIPVPGTARLPAVVLVHGSGGVGGNVIDWANELQRLGIAVFVLDSFTGRGVVSTVADQSLVSSVAMLFDAYRALEILAKHPRIDPERIAIMGFSKGAIASTYASLERFQKMHGPAAASFAAYVSLYAPCNTEFTGDTAVAKKPIRFFHGAADDYVPAGPCRDYVARLKAAGADASLAEYPGAHHAFDSTILKAPVKLPQAVTFRNCRLAERPEGTIVNADTNKPLTPADPCVERGATVAHSPEATTAVRADVTKFFREAFKL